MVACARIYPGSLEKGCEKGKEALGLEAAKEGLEVTLEEGGTLLLPFPLPASRLRKHFRFCV